MGHMKDFDRRIRQGGDDAIAAVGEYVAHLESELARLRHFVPPVAGTVDAESGMGFISESSLQCVAESMASYVTRAAEVPKGFEPRAISTYGFVMPRWIPVGERLPGEGEQVIVWMPDCPHHPCGMDMGSCMTDSIWGVTWMVSGGRSAFPSHWMPLPEPPST